MHSLFFKETTPAEIQSVTMKLKNKSSYGFDELSTTLVKKVIPLISDTLSEIINLSLSTGIVPENMKIAKVIPLFKSQVTIPFAKITGQYQFYLRYRRLQRKLYIIDC